MRAADPIKRGQEERRLENMGFKFIKRISCAACGIECDWYWTSKRKLILLTAETLQPHWKICKRAYGNTLPVKIKQDPYFRWPHG